MTTQPPHQWSHPRVAAYFGGRPGRSPRTRSHVPPGWDGVVADALEALDRLEAESGHRLLLRQIKEKFGGLRLYVGIEATTPVAGPSTLPADRLRREVDRIAARAADQIHPARVTRLHVEWVVSERMALAVARLIDHA